MLVVPLTLIAVLAFLVSDELKTSAQQASYLAHLGKDIGFPLRAGPAPSVRYPNSPSFSTACARAAIR
jgi:hypothetical protein